MESIKPIILRDEDSGVEYILEFNADSVKFAEARGFDLDDVGKYPMTKTPELFYYAFRMHHRRMSRAETDKIYFDDLGGITTDMLRRLAELYAAPCRALYRDDDAADRPTKMSVSM